MKTHILFLVFCMCTCVVTSAHAQDSAAQESRHGPVVAYLGIGIFSSTTVGALVFLISSPEISNIPLVRTTPHSVRLLQGYIKQNHIQVVQDISIGTGSAFKDLASLYGIKPNEYGAFARALRHERAHVCKLLEADFAPTYAAMHALHFLLLKIVERV